MGKDPIKAHARQLKYRARLHAEKYGPTAGDQRGCHGNHARGEKNASWRGGNPKPSVELRRRNAKASAARYPEKCKARQQVQDAVRRGQLPRVRSCLCYDCGNPAQSYDHWRGYDTPLDVQAVCFKCHGKRSVARGEHKLNGRKRAAKAIFGKRPLPDDLMVREMPR